MHPSRLPAGAPGDSELLVSGAAVGKRPSSSLGDDALPDQSAGPCAAAPDSGAFPVEKEHLPPQKKGEGAHMSSVSVGVPEGAQVVVLPGPFPLDSGFVLRDVPLAYSTYGTLAPDGRNAVLVGHSLTSSTNVHEWWAAMLGDGDKFCLDKSK